MNINEWIKANCTSATTCVEVMNTGTGIRVRNSSDPDGTILDYTYDEWAAFLAGAKDGEFDLA